MRKCVDAHPTPFLVQGGGDPQLESPADGSHRNGGVGSWQDPGREEVRVC